MMVGQALYCDIDDRVKELTMQMKSEVETRTNEKYSVFIPVQAMKQVVEDRLVCLHVGGRSELFHQGRCR